MWGIQVKAFSLLAVVLLIVDAAAFHGEYREIVGHKIASAWKAVTPSHWNGLGSGRSWTRPKPSRSS